MAPLTLVDPPSASGSTLDELLGSSFSRPGELCEPLHQPVDARFQSALKKAGLPVSAGVTWVIERELILNELGHSDRGTAEAHLDERASRGLPTTAPSGANADYARKLFAAVNGGLPHNSDAAPVVVPSRLVGRIRSQPALKLCSRNLPSAMRWELAAVRQSRTMTEWALYELLVEAGHMLAAARQLPAASAAS